MSENQFCKFRVESLKSYSLPAIGYRLVDGSPFYSLQAIADNVCGFREVFAKQKFGWSLQGGISKSLLNEGERSERLQAVPD